MYIGLSRFRLRRLTLSRQHKTESQTGVWRYKRGSVWKWCYGFGSARWGKSLLDNSATFILLRTQLGDTWLNDNHTRRRDWRVMIGNVYLLPKDLGFQCRMFPFFPGGEYYVFTHWPNFHWETHLNGTHLECRTEVYSTVVEEKNTLTQPYLNRNALLVSASSSSHINIHPQSIHHQLNWPAWGRRSVLRENDWQGDLPVTSWGSSVSINLHRCFCWLVLNARSAPYHRISQTQLPNEGYFTQLPPKWQRNSLAANATEWRWWVAAHKMVVWTLVRIGWKLLGSAGFFYLIS